MIYADFRLFWAIILLKFVLIIFYCLEKNQITLDEINVNEWYYLHLYRVCVCICVCVCMCVCVHPRARAHEREFVKVLKILCSGDILVLGFLGVSFIYLEGLLLLLLLYGWSIRLGGLLSLVIGASVKNILFMLIIFNALYLKD